MPDTEHSPQRPAACDVEVHLDRSVRQTIDVAWLKRMLLLAACAVAAEQRPATCCIRVRVVDDAAMMSMHARHCSVASTTDVLTFDMRDDPSLPIDADIVICADEAARRAAEFSHSIERELLLYCIHGLLHCAGFDDHTEESWRRMHAREDAILDAIGVGATFGRGESGHPTREERGA